MTARRAEQRKTVVILGEDENDRSAVKILVAALRPDLARGGLKPLRKPMALVRGIPAQRLPSEADRVSRVLRAFAVREPIRCVFMHEDADDVEPAHKALIEKIERCYRDLPWPVHAVVPAWETETWWFLFPEALRAARPSWRILDGYAGKNVGKIRNAKEQLKKAVKPIGSKAAFKTYEEADSVLIAEKIVELELLASPWFAHSASWLAFIEKVAKA